MCFFFCHQALSTPVTSTQADSTQQPQAPETQQQHMQQFYQLSNEIRDSVDQLEIQPGSDYNEAKPLADLLINSNMTHITYNQVDIYLKLNFNAYISFLQSSLEYLFLRIPV